MIPSGVLHRRVILDPLAAALVFASPALLGGCGDGVPSTSVGQPWTAFETSQAHRRARRSVIADRIASLPATAPAERSAEAWAGVIRGATVAGAELSGDLMPIGASAAPFPVRLAAAVHRAEVDSDGSAVAQLDALAAEAPVGRASAYARSAAACAAIRAHDVPGGGGRSARVIAEQATRLASVSEVPEGPLSEAAAHLELASLEPAGTEMHVAAARAALARLDAPIGSAARAVKRGTLFGIASMDAETVIIVDGSDRLGSIADEVDALVLASAGEDAKARLIRLSHEASAGSSESGGAPLRAAIERARSGAARPRRIVVMLGAAPAGQGRADRVLGDRLGREGIPVHFVLLSGAGSPSDLVSEIARRSRGSVRTVDPAAISAIARRTVRDEAERLGGWDAMHDRQLALLKMGIAALEASEIAEGTIEQALANLDPDPVTATPESGDCSDWRALLLAGGLACADASAAERFARAAAVLAGRATVAAEEGRDDDAQRFRELAARSILLGCMAGNLPPSAKRIASGLERAERLEVLDGTWSGRLLEAAAGGWSASVRASRGVRGSPDEAAARAWELAAVESIFRGGEPPSAVAPPSLPPWEARVFSHALGRPAAGISSGAR